MKKYYVAHVFYLPMAHAISLINKGFSKDQACQATIDKFAYSGSRKRNKDFNIQQFRRHLDRFVDTPNAILVRKSRRVS